MSRGWYGKERYVGDEEREREELPDDEEDEVAVLSAREAMSLISPDATTASVGEAGEQSPAEGADHVESERSRTSQL